MNSLRSLSLRACGSATGRALRSSAKLSGVGAMLILALTFTPSLHADTTVPAQTVTSGQTLNVSDPAQVITSGNVIVNSGGAASFQGGTAVKLEPGFSALAGSFFRAFVDLNLGGFASLADSDLDGLPDAWELLHFGNLTATGAADSDGDGLTNSNEYLAGSNPTLNENTANLPGSTQVVVRTPSGAYKKVLTDWSITAAP